MSTSTLARRSCLLHFIFRGRDGKAGTSSVAVEHDEARSWMRSRHRFLNEGSCTGVTNVTEPHPWSWQLFHGACNDCGTCGPVRSLQATCSSSCLTSNHSPRDQDYKASLSPGRGLVGSMCPEAGAAGRDPKPAPETANSESFTPPAPKDPRRKQGDLCHVANLWPNLVPEDTGWTPGPLKPRLRQSLASESCILHPKPSVTSLDCTDTFHYTAFRHEATVRQHPSLPHTPCKSFARVFPRQNVGTDYTE